MLDATRFASALKVLFPQRKLTMFGEQKQPFWNYLTKRGGFGGRNAEVPIRYSPGGGGNSHTFLDAQESKDGAFYTHFVYTRRRDYKVISIDAEALEASEGDNGAYLSAKKAEVEAALEQIVNQLGRDLQGDGTGHTATIVSVDAGTDSFVVGDNEIMNFERGNRIQTAASPFSALRPGTVGYMVVLRKNTNTNTVFVDPAAGDGIAAYAAAAADRVYPKGNFNLSLQGTEAWIPTDRTGLATPFNQVDRSLDESRLAGIFFDGSAFGLAECFERACARAAKEGVFVDTFWVNFNRFQDLSLDLGAKAVREPYKIGNFAYDTISMTAGGRKVRFMADQNFADTTSLGTTKESWFFHQLGETPRMLAKGQMIVESTADGWELRFGWRGNLVCPEPRANIRIALPT